MVTINVDIATAAGLFAGLADATGINMVVDAVWFTNTHIAIRPVGGTTPTILEVGGSAVSGITLNRIIRGV